MTKRAIWVALLLAVSAAAVAAEPLIDGDADAGKEKSATCAGCHGADGNSTSAQFPKLAGQGAKYIVEQLQLFKSGKRENAVMSAQAKGLSEQDMKNLAVYFAAQEIKPGSVSDTKLVQKGAKIYHGGAPEFEVPACSGCHGPAGQGNPAANYPRISGQHADYIEQQLMAYRDGDRSGYDNAEIMQGVTRGLSNDQIKALAAYVSALMPLAKGEENTSGALYQNPPQTTDDKSADQGDQSDQADESDKAEESDQGDQPDQADESDEANKSDQGDQSDQADESDEAEKSDQNDKSDQADESDEAEKSDQNDKSDQADESDEVEKSDHNDKSDQADESDEVEKSDYNDKSDQADESDEVEKSDQNDKSDQADESDETEKSDQGDKADQANESEQSDQSASNNVVVTDTVDVTNS